MMDGHFAGQALLALHKNGITDTNRIIGAKGKRPFVKNLDKDQVERFQAQIELVELIGNDSPDDIIQSVTIALSKAKQAFPEKAMDEESGNEVIAQNPQNRITSYNVCYTKLLRLYRTLINGTTLHRIIFNK